MNTENIDKKLLAFFQKVSDRLQIVFGITSFSIAKIFLCIFFLGFALRAQATFGLV